MTADWNELAFMRWNDFRKMAPSILKLEIRRLTQLIQRPDQDTELHNALVRARFEVKTLVQELENSETRMEPDQYTSRLSRAVLSLSGIRHLCDAETGEIIDYILDRLNDIYNRLKLIY